METVFINDVEASLVSYTEDGGAMVIVDTCDVSETPKINLLEGSIESLEKRVIELKKERQNVWTQVNDVKDKLLDKNKTLAKYNLGDIELLLEDKVTHVLFRKEVLTFSEFKDVLKKDDRRFSITLYMKDNLKLESYKSMGNYTQTPGFFSCLDDAEKAHKALVVHQITKSSYNVQYRYELIVENNLQEEFPDEYVTYKKEVESKLKDAVRKSKLDYESKKENLNNFSKESR